MIRHALARVLHAVADRVDSVPASNVSVTYTVATTPYPYEVWCGSRSPSSTSTTY